ncbi:MAG: DUF4295 domain-containing protein [Flavobacteriales bacterium]
MARKAKQQSQGSKDQTMCIKMVKSPKNNAYYFREEVLPNDRVEDFFKEEGQEEEQEEASNG